MGDLDIIYFNDMYTILDYMLLIYLYYMISKTLMWLDQIKDCDAIWLISYHKELRFFYNIFHMPLGGLCDVDIGSVENKISIQEIW